MGRPTISSDEIHRIWKLRREGNTRRAIARITGLARNTVNKWAHDTLMAAVAKMVEPEPSK